MSMKQLSQNSTKPIQPFGLARISHQFHGKSAQSWMRGGLAAAARVSLGRRLQAAALSACAIGWLSLSAVQAEPESAWESVILPILEQKCNHCHNEDRTRGRLRMDTYELLMQGGSIGDTVIPGDVEGSELLFRLHLPLDDDEHMPPEGEEQLTDAEIAILTWWIAQGASETAAVAELDPDEAVLQALADWQAGEPPAVAAPRAAPVEEEFKLPQPDDEARGLIAAAVADLEDIGATLMPVAQDRGGLQFSALNAIPTLEDAHLQALEPVAEWVISVDLARTQITDAALKPVADMVHLERLNLENTPITDAALDFLVNLPRLNYLNLYGTGVTDEGLQKLTGLKNLQAIYLWQTEVTEAGAEAFAGKVPGLVAHLGLDDEGNERVIVSTASRVVSVPPEVLEELRVSVALSSEAAKAAAEAAEAASKAAEEARLAAESAALKLAELEERAP